MHIKMSTEVNGGKESCLFERAESVVMKKDGEGDGRRGEERKGGCLSERKGCRVTGDGNTICV